MLWDVWSIGVKGIVISSFIPVRRDCSMNMYSDLNSYSFALLGHINLNLIITGFKIYNVRPNWNIYNGNLIDTPISCSQYKINNRILHSFNPRILRLLCCKSCTIRIMPEFLVLLPKFGNDNLVGISDRLDLEKSVHSLKGDRLSFRDQKVDKGDGKNHKRCKEEIDAISHR